jgi:hypothetical protein
MSLRNPCRLQVEQLEQRDVPAAPGLTGTHVLHTTFSAQLFSDLFLPPVVRQKGSDTVEIQGKLGNGLLKHATVSFNGAVTSQSGFAFDFAGTSTFVIPRHGSVSTTDTGSVDAVIPGGALTLTGTVTGGTGAFRGVTGSFTANGVWAGDGSPYGTINFFAESFRGTLTGFLSGPPRRHHR